MRVGSKSKKDKSEAGSLAATSTADVSTVDAVPEPVVIPDSRPSLAIPDNLAMDQRPLSAIVESPIVPLNSQAVWGDVQPAGLTAAVMSSPLANTATMADSPVDAKPEEVTSEPEIVEAPAEVVAPAPPSPELHEVTALPVEPAAPIEPAPPTEEVQPVVTQEEESKDTVAALEAPAAASGATTPARVETSDIAPPPANNLLSPISPNSPSSTPWDPTAQREIARARSPRRSSAGGPSNRSRLPSPAASIIGVKRKLGDEPELAKGRVRYLPGKSVFYIL
jgi:DNA polymerase-3 subunit gamma/tau